MMPSKNLPTNEATCAPRLWPAIVTARMFMPIRIRNTINRINAFATI